MIKEPSESFLQEESRGGYVVSAQMKRVWAVQLDMVQRLLEVCQRHGIRIFADGGTVLGAVRHHGYIPWDDDIDMIMFRDDYEKLVSVAAEEFREPYCLLTGREGNGYIRGHAQLRNSSTTAILKSEGEKGRHVNYNLGVFIDIFIFDGVEEDDASFAQRQAKYKKVVKQMRVLCQAFEQDRLSLKSRLYASWLILRGKSLRKLYAEGEDIMRLVPCSSVETVSPLGLFFEKGSSCRRKVLYSDVVMMDFEYIQIPIPVGYEEFLTVRYGADYMTPKHDSTSHGGFSVLDPDRSYREYM